MKENILIFVVFSFSFFISCNINEGNSGEITIDIYDCYLTHEMFPYLLDAEQRIRNFDSLYNSSQTDSDNVNVDSAIADTSLLDILTSDENDATSTGNAFLFSKLLPNTNYIGGSGNDFTLETNRSTIIGFAFAGDTQEVNQYFSDTNFFKLPQDYFELFWYKIENVDTLSNLYGLVILIENVKHARFKTADVGMISLEKKHFMFELMNTLLNEKDYYADIYLNDNAQAELNQLKNPDKERFVFMTLGDKRVHASVPPSLFKNGIRIADITKKERDNIMKTFSEIALYREPL